MWKINSKLSLLLAEAQVWLRAIEISLKIIEKRSPQIKQKLTYLPKIFYLGQKRANKYIFECGPNTKIFLTCLKIS